MIYKFITIGDIHWGAMDSDRLYHNLSIVLEFIKQVELDFVVIAGDYFDFRLNLNSKNALYATKWFDELYYTCKDKVKRLRLVKGTREHDNDQLEIFRTYEDDTNFFKIINTTESENLFEDLRVVYCPDENMNLKDYHNTYYQQFIPNPDIGFFHGNFDAILPTIEYDRIQNHELPIMIYEYNKFSRLIKGPLISGHWHNGQDYKALSYVGSFDRWKFNEEEEKGFLYTEYNTEDNSYFNHRVVNPFTIQYKTIMISNKEYHSISKFTEVERIIQEEFQKDSMMMLKIILLVEEDNEEAIRLFNEVTKRYASNKQIKFIIKDLLKKEKRKEKSKVVKMNVDKYDYVFNKDIKSIPEIIQKFILDKDMQDIPIDTIKKYVEKYLK